MWRPTELISTYQIRNVLRVYGNDLKKRTMILQGDSGDEKKQSPDFISISDEARNKEVKSKISDRIFSQITKNDYPNDMIK